MIISLNVFRTAYKRKVAFCQPSVYMSNQRQILADSERHTMLDPTDPDFPCHVKSLKIVPSAFIPLNLQTPCTIGLFVDCIPMAFSGRVTQLTQGFLTNAGWYCSHECSKGPYQPNADAGNKFADAS